MSLEDIDTREWPTIRFGGASVRLKKGSDYICVSKRETHDPLTKEHDHILTLAGLEKIVLLTDDEDMRQLLEAKKIAQKDHVYHEVLLPRDPEKEAFRKDHDRLRRIHREGNG